MAPSKARLRLLRTSSPPVTKKETAMRRLFTYPLVRTCDMETRMKKAVIEIVENACTLFAGDLQTAAQLIKETLDQNYGGRWHAIVGENFGIYINYDPQTLLYMFYGGNLAICVWKFDG